MKTVYVVSQWYEDSGTTEMLAVFTEKADAEEWCLDVYMEALYDEFCWYMYADNDENTIKEAMKGVKDYIPFATDMLYVDECQMFE